jgi:hypothetical protein
MLLASKFTIPPIVHIVKGNFSTYELKVNVLEIIMGALEKVKLLG